MFLASVRNHPGFVRLVTAQLDPRQWHLPTTVTLPFRRDAYLSAEVGYVWSILIISLEKILSLQNERGATSAWRTRSVKTGLRPEGSIISCRGQAPNPEWTTVALATFRLITDIGLIQCCGARLLERAAVTLSASDKLAEPPGKEVEIQTDIFHTVQAY